MRQCYMKERGAETPPTDVYRNSKPARRAICAHERRIGDEVARCKARPGPNPSALMRSPHDLHGVFDMAPLPGFLGVALALAGHGILGRRGDSLEAVLLDHLPGDRMNLHLGYHVALLMFRHSEPQGPVPVGRWTPFNGLTGGLVPPGPAHSFAPPLGYFGRSRHGRQ